MKKGLLLAAAALLGISSASAADWFISGNFQGWQNCKAGYSMTETESGVFVYEVKDAGGMYGEFLIVQGTVNNPNWNTKIGTNGAAVVAGTPYKYVKGAGNFSLGTATVANAVVTLNTNDGTLLVAGKEEANEYDTVSLVGAFGSGWNESNTNFPLTLKEGTENVWTGEYTLAAATSYFKMRAGNNIYGTGMDSDIAVELGKEYTAKMSGNSFSIAAGKYTFTYVLDKNAETGKLTVTSDAAVTYPENMYIQGSFINAQWDPSQAVAMTNEGDGIYTATNVQLGNSDLSGFAYFSFSTGIGADKTDWNVGTRYGATANDFEVVFGEAMTITAGENAFKTTADLVVNITLDLENKTVVVEEVKAEYPDTPTQFNATFSVAEGSTVTGEFVWKAGTLDEGAHLEGEFKTSADALNVTVEAPENYDLVLWIDMSNIRGDYSAAKASDPSDWISLEGALGYYPFTVGNEIAVPADGEQKVYGIVFGKDNEVNMVSMTELWATVVKDDAVGVNGIEVEAAEAVYFNLQGVKVANPENGVFVKVVNGKASKVVL